MTERYKRNMGGLTINIERLEFIKREILNGKFFSLRFEKEAKESQPKVVEETRVRRKVWAAARGFARV